VKALAVRTQRSLREAGFAPGDSLLVALSGGRDSVSLLHLLRFAAGDLRPRLIAAHFDHAMRPESHRDAAWVSGLCAAWGVPLVSGVAGEALRGETDARRARYAFLRQAAAEAAAPWIATAHHADDQAETVLFRVLRGTGLDGLGGIAPCDGAGLIRPLLGCWRREIRRYAREEGVRWRGDPTNAFPSAARNRLRLRALPWLERHVASGARRSLVRLATLAREERDAWRAALSRLAPEGVSVDGDTLLLDRAAFRRWERPLAARVLRAALERFAQAPDYLGTRAAIQFIIEAPAGRSWTLAGGVQLHADRHTVWVRRNGPAAPDRPLRLGAREAAAGGGAALLVGGRAFRAEWMRRTASGRAADAGSAELRWDGLRFPLCLRGRRSGDRIRTPGGTKTLKKLLIERRVPRPLRPAVPLLADAHGALVWVADLAVAEGLRPYPGDDALLLRLSDA
jgi:tRNA(Ile)-lysidine synthase